MSQTALTLAQRERIEGVSRELVGRCRDIAATVQTDPNGIEKEAISLAVASIVEFAKTPDIALEAVIQQMGCQIACRVKTYDGAVDIMGRCGGWLVDGYRAAEGPRR